MLVLNMNVHFTHLFPCSFACCLGNMSNIFSPMSSSPHWNLIDRHRPSPQPSSAFVRVWAVGVIGMPLVLKPRPDLTVCFFVSESKDERDKEQAQSSP